MKRNIDVVLGDGIEVGTLRYDLQGRRESAAFEYDAGWLGDPAHFTLGPSLPLQAGPLFHRKSKDGSLFHAAIADTEPDGWARRVIVRDHIKRRRELRREGKEEAQPLNALDYLLAVDDFSRVGALRFRDEDGVFRRAQEEGRRTAPPLIELGALLSASRAVEANKETAADLAYLRGRGTSLGGMRPKCTVIDEDGSLSIGKFPSITDERVVTKGEVLALTLARKAGINAATARIVQSEELPVALIRRFDRQNNDHRLMYVSAATMLGVEVTEPEEHTYTEIVDATLASPDLFFAKELAGEEPPSFAAMKRLYERANDLFGVRPWQMLDETELIATRDSKMGSKGEVYSMHAYRGEEGLRLFRSIAAEDLTDPGEVLASTHCLSVEFVPRKELKRQDRDLLAALSHQPGRGLASPVFRVIRPGFHPWFVNAEEAHAGRVHSLTAALQARPG